MDLDTVADGLYAVPPAEFTTLRTARAKEAKEAGDKELAARIVKLAKPAVAAWVVNMLVRHRAHELDQVLRLGVALREAQESVDPGQMRALTTQRRQLTAAVTRAAKRLAADLDQPVSAAAAEQVEATLHAAMVDADAADAVAAGQLTKPLLATGFGSVDVSSAMATVARRPRPHPDGPQLSVVRDDTREREEAQQHAHEAAETLREAQVTAESTGQEAERLAAKALELEERLDELRRAVADREHELEALETERSAAARADDTAQESLSVARHEAVEAHRRLERLGTAPTDS